MAKEILLLGEFSTGKSAFINMLLGVSILPEQLESTNLPVIKIHAGDAAGLWLREAGQKYPRHLTRWKEIPETWAEFEYAEITIPEHPILQSDIVFWDTPGINSTNMHHNKHLEKFLELKYKDFDLILFFVNKNITKTSLEFLKKWKHFSEKTYIIQNFRDNVTIEQLKLLNDDLKLTLCTQNISIAVEYLYMVDIQEEFFEKSDENKNGQSDWSLLHEWLTRKVDIANLKQENRETNWFFLQKLEKAERRKDAMVQSINMPSNMVLVEGGTFSMGSNENSDEKPIHSVTVNSFYMGKYPITQKQWVEIMGSNPSKWKGDNLPVERVSWDDIQVFLSKLNQKTRMNYRLPTEAEWEYEAKGGNKSRGYKYSGSDNIDDVAWYVDNSGNNTHEVGTKQPDELGIYDMSGNVWEWCSDWYAENYYESSSSNNPKGPSSGEYSVLRGGSWGNNVSNCRSALRRDRVIPMNRGGNVGFRLVQGL